MHNYKLYGTSYNSNDYNAIDVVLYPCASKIKLFDGREVGGDDSCIWDEALVNEYLGKAFWMKAYSNQ